jgi:uncharacterized membrane-anchored protein
MLSDKKLRQELKRLQEENDALRHENVKLHIAWKSDETLKLIINDIKPEIIIKQNINDEKEIILRYIVSKTSLLKFEKQAEMMMKI